VDIYVHVQLLVVSLFIDYNNNNNTKFIKRHNAVRRL